MNHSPPGINSGFSSVTVDPQIMTSNGQLYDVIFVGTRSGGLLKTVNTLPTHAHGYRPVLIEEIEAVNGPIIQLEVIS